MLLYIIKWCESFCVRFRLWVINKKVVFCFVLSCLIRLKMFLVVFWFKFFVGLFVSIKLGLFIKVWVIVMRWCLLFESVDGWCVIWWDNLIVCNIFLVWFFVFDLFCFLINIGIIMFFNVVKFVIKWWNWYIKFKCWFCKFVSLFVFSFCKDWFCIYILFEFGWFKLLSVCKSVFLFELELFIIVINLLVFIEKEIFFNICIFWLFLL